MAHVEHYNSKQYYAVLKEVFRELTEYKNDVNEDLSKYNFVVNDIRSSSMASASIKKRISEILEDKKLRPNTNIMSNWVISLPKDEIFKDLTEQKRFWKETLSFLKDRYGEDNVISGVVHNDETNPHFHVQIVPEAISRKNGKKTISTASLFTKNELKTFHIDFDKHIERAFNKPNLVLNGATKGGVSLDTLKAITERKRASEELSKVQDDLFSKKNELKATETALEITQKSVTSSKLKKMDIENRITAKENLLDTVLQEYHKQKALLENIAKELSDKEKKLEELKEREEKLKELQALEEKEKELKITVEKLNKEFNMLDNLLETIDKHFQGQLNYCVEQFQNLEYDQEVYEAIDYFNQMLKYCYDNNIYEFDKGLISYFENNVYQERNGFDR